MYGVFRRRRGRFEIMPPAKQSAIPHCRTKVLRYTPLGRTKVLRYTPLGRTKVLRYTPSAGLNDYRLKPIDSSRD